MTAHPNSTSAINPRDIDRLSDVGVDAKAKGAVMLFANKRGRRAIDKLWPGMLWRTDDIFRLGHSDDWLFAHLVVHALPQHFEEKRPLAECVPDAVGFVVALALSAKAPRLRVFHYVGEPPDVGVRIYKQVAAPWFRQLRVVPEVKVLLAPGGGVH
jgi:hypothetical protein